MKDIREKLTPKQKALFKLVLWCVLMVWMVLFATHTVITAQILARWAPAAFPQSLYYQMLAKSIPAWYVFTVALIIILVARYAYRKLRPQFRRNPDSKSKEHNKIEVK
jgi:glycerol-3-phosphate acyltransferase PlsY